jgi:Bacterial low temperature requirement A protein (LtrA)
LGPGGPRSPAPFRSLCWALAVAGEAAAPILATARSAGLPLHLEHLPERFGLLIILVLGESVAAVAVGVHDTHWDPTTVTAAVLAFVVAAGLWWTYFDLTGAATTDTLTQRAGHRTTPLHDIYAYGHWPIALGLTAAGVGLEDAILHANQPSLPAAARWILCGGLALYLLSLTAIQGGIAGSLRSVLPWPVIGVPSSLPSFSLAASILPPSSAPWPSSSWVRSLPASPTSAKARRPGQPPRIDHRVWVGMARARATPPVRNAQAGGARTKRPHLLSRDARTASLGPRSRSWLAAKLTVSASR